MSETSTPHADTAGVPDPIEVEAKRYWIDTPFQDHDEMMQLLRRYEYLCFSVNPEDGQISIWHKKTLDEPGKTHADVDPVGLTRNTYGDFHLSTWGGGRKYSSRSTKS